MSRPIDADSLIEEITAFWDLNTGSEIKSDTVIRQIITDIKNMPTMDIAEDYEYRIKQLASINEEMFKLVSEQNKRIRELESEHTYRRTEKV